MKFQKPRIILIVILTVVFAVSAFHIIKITHDYKTADKTYRKALRKMKKELKKKDIL